MVCGTEASAVMAAALVSALTALEPLTTLVTASTSSIAVTATKASIDANTTERICHNNFTDADFDENNPSYHFH